MELNEQLKIYDELGFCYFPLPYGKKEPVIEWKKYQTTQPTKEDKQAWRGNGKQFNVALVMGKVSERDGASLVALDFDMAINYHNFEQKASELLGCKLSDITPIVKTSRGYHVWFYIKEPCQSVQASTVEVHANGYMVAPPSLHPGGKHYEFLNPQVTLPYTLDSLLQVGINVNQPKSQKADGTPQNWITEAMNGVPEGQRDDTCTRLAGYYIGKDIAPDIVKSILHGLADKCPQPPGAKEPFTHQDVDRIVDSIYFKERLKTPEDTIRGDTPNGVLYPNSIPTPSLEKGGCGGESVTHAQNVTRYETERYKNVTTTVTAYQIEEWLSQAGGRFTVEQLDNDLCIRSFDEKNNRRQVLWRCKDKGLVEKDPTHNNVWYVVDAGVEDINPFGIVKTNPLPLKWAFGIEDYVKIFAGDLIVVAGSKDAGKTALLLDFLFRNKDNHECRYFSSELGQERLFERLSKFECAMEDWNNVAWKRRKASANWADIIRPDAYTVIDFIEIHENFFEIAKPLAAIHSKIGNGIVIVAVQKAKNAPLGRGAEFTLEKASLALSLDNGRVEVMTGKTWKDKDVNPVGMTAKFKLVEGCNFKIYLPLGHHEDD